MSIFSACRKMRSAGSTGKFDVLLESKSVVVLESERQNCSLYNCNDLDVAER